MVGQRTLRTSIRATGVGLHTGKQIMMTLRPALPDSGICFRRVDLPEPIDIAARAANVGETTLGTTLVNGSARISTVEHLLSAFAGPVSYTHLDVYKRQYWRKAARIRPL